MRRPGREAAATIASVLPLRDRNPTLRTPWVTIGLIAANVLIFVLWQPTFGSEGERDAFYYCHALIPYEVTHGTDLADGGAPAREAISRRFGDPETGPDMQRFLLRTCAGKQPYLPLLVAMFLHGGWLHLAGNMLFLWVFGNNVEDFLGPVKYLLFYLLGGIAASFAHIAVSLGDVVPSVGASGAVAAVMGAYIVLFPHARVRVLVPIFIFFMTQMSAWAVLGLWFVYQFIIGAQAATEATSVAWMAHVGGFAFGVAAIYLLGGRPHRPAPLWRPGWSN